MTTAARPTFEPAKGGRERGDLSTISKQYSSRDLPGHTKLKYRQDTQVVSDDLSHKELKRQLDEKESQAPTSRSRKRNRFVHRSFVCMQFDSRRDSLHFRNLFSSCEPSENHQ